MNHFQNLLCIAIIVAFALFAFGPSYPGHAAPSTVEPEQFSCTNVTQIPQSECEALVALYNGTNGQRWADATGWLDSTMPCSWYRVTCADGRTTRLNLEGTRIYHHFGLRGDLPAEIDSLTNLTTLSLWNNELSSLPAEIGNLTNLTSLSLVSNELRSLPAEIGNLTNLTQLHLYDN